MASFEFSALSITPVCDAWYTRGNTTLGCVGLILIDRLIGYAMAPLHAGGNWKLINNGYSITTWHAKEPLFCGPINIDSSLNNSLGSLRHP